MKKIPIVVCTAGSPCIEVMKASVRSYAPDHELIIHSGPKTTFGEAYNTALTKAFERYDEVIVSNDDVVLTPTSLTTLMNDVQKLKNGPEKIKIGFVGTMHDSARPGQNIRYSFFERDEINFGKWTSENFIKLVPVVAPIFAYLSKEAFAVAQFPPISWYSDDIICEDLTSAGFKHFISSSYVHHVGSSTMGHKYNELREEALPWIYENRPQYMEELNRRLSFGRSTPT
jgi:hypothetical protein